MSETPQGTAEARRLPRPSTGVATTTRPVAGVATRASDRKARRMVDHFRVALTLGRDRAGLRLCGELDAATTGQFSAAFERACAAEPALLLIDLTELSFCDAAGVRVLVLSAAQCARNNLELRIVGAQPHVRRVFEITNTDDLLPISNDGDDQH